MNGTFIVMTIRRTLIELGMHPISLLVIRDWVLEELTGDSMTKEIKDFEAMTTISKGVAHFA